MRSRAVDNGQSRVDDRELNNDVEEAEIKSSSSSRRYDSVGENSRQKWMIAMLCLGIFFGVFLSLSIDKNHAMLKEPIKGLHRNVKNAYIAHNVARKEYLKSYHEAYLESILAATGPSSSLSSSSSSLDAEEIEKGSAEDVSESSKDSEKNVIAHSRQVNDRCLGASDRYLTSLLVDKVVNEGIFRSFVFTRWRTPAVYAKKGKKGGKGGEMPKMEKKLPPLSYDELANMPKVDRFSAMRAGLSRLAEFDFRHEYPPIYHKFDVVVFWSHWVSANALQYSTWQNGDICSCFIEIPEEAVPDILDDAIRGMKNSSPSKTCFRTLVFGGGDTHISNPRILNLVKSFHDSQYFDQIYYEAMDVGIEYIKPLPTGLLDFYVLGIPQGKFESALKKINLGTKQGVLAAWGTVWPHLDRELPWRRSLIDWVNSTEWIQRSHIPMQNWHEELAKYRFYIVPDGNGVCSAKWTESLILQTIPIVPPLEYYKLLKEEGYPIVVVDSWDDITPQNMNLWWDELSSSLEAASWLHTTDCWWTYVSTPHTSVEEVLERCLPKSKCR